MSRDFPQRSIIEATLRNLLVEDKERLVCEERSDVLCLFSGGSSEALRGDVSLLKILRSFPRREDEQK